MDRRSFMEMSLVQSNILSIVLRDAQKVRRKTKTSSGRTSTTSIVLNLWCTPISGCTKCQIMSSREIRGIDENCGGTGGLDLHNLQSWKVM